MSPQKKGARDGRRPMRIIEDSLDDGFLPRSGFVQQLNPADALRAPLSEHVMCQKHQMRKHDE